MTTSYNRNTTVVISVSGGVASVEHAPDGFEVLVIDYDNIEENPDYCPICGEDISENTIGICDGCGFDLNNDFSDISIDAIFGE
jgi:hypothetical protein